jgi:hypothetical protein
VELEAPGDHGGRSFVAQAQVFDLDRPLRGDEEVVIVHARSGG